MESNLLTHEQMESDIGKASFKIKMGLGIIALGAFCNGIMLYKLYNNNITKLAELKIDKLDSIQE
jgi:hypothetical protein